MRQGQRTLPLLSLCATQHNNTTRNMMTQQELDQLRTKERSLWNALKVHDEENKRLTHEWAELHRAVKDAERDLEIELLVQQRLAAAQQNLSTEAPASVSTGA